MTHFACTGPLLLDAIARFSREPARPPLLAIDLGCGEGTDTLALLQAGWRVLATDKEPEAIARLQARVRPELSGHLTTRVMAFEEDVQLPKAHLIHAGFSLPFCSPARFDALWGAVVDALLPGGRFVGQLFGPRDSWANRTNMTFHTLEEVRDLCSCFEVESFQEVDEDGRAVSGPKHWHLFHIIGRKPER